MSNYRYIYIDPITQGYTRVKLSKKAHNEILPYYPRDWRTSYEYYVTKGVVLIHKFSSPTCVALSFLLFVPFLILNGLMNYKNTWADQKSMIWQKKYGSFMSEKVCATSAPEMYKKLVNAARPF